MNKILFAVLVVACAATVLQFAAAKKEKPNKHSCASNKGTGSIEANERCYKNCFKNSTGTQLGSCLNGTCVCFARPNNNTNATTPSMVPLFELPTLSEAAQPHIGKNKKINCTANNGTGTSEANLRCNHKCLEKPRQNLMGSCQNGNCTCFPRPTNNTNATTPSMVTLFDLPMFELPSEDDSQVETNAQKKQKNVLFNG